MSSVTPNDEDTLYIPGIDFIIKSPKFSEWKVEMFPGTVLSPLDNGNIPNWFQRKMQQLVFGFRWYK